MQFCAAAGRDNDALDRAFAGLSLDTSRSDNASAHRLDFEDGRFEREGDAVSKKELGMLLMAMRKLREGIVGAGRTDTFAQRVYVFIIRAAILTSTFESYAPALLHLLHKINVSTPLPAPELHEFVGYHILDLACRLGDYVETYAVRNTWGYRDERVEGVLRALVHDDWVGFWRLRGVVDGYQKRLMGWAEDAVRRHALKCLGRGYLSVEKGYVEKCAGRPWEELKRWDGVGWELEGNRVTIRRVKAK